MKGKPCSEESLKDYEKTWSDMEECFNKIKKEAKVVSKDKQNDKRINN